MGDTLRSTISEAQEALLFDAECQGFTVEESEESLRLHAPGGDCRMTIHPYKPNSQSMMVARPSRYKLERVKTIKQARKWLGL